jgi:hypothetical protein
MKQFFVPLILLSCAAPLAQQETTLSPISQPSAPPFSQPASLSNQQPISLPTSAPLAGATLTPPPQPKSIFGMRTFIYEPWNISMFIPDEAVSDVDVYLNLRFQMSGATLVLKRIHAPPPEDLTQVDKHWSWGNELKIIQEGVHANGTIFRIVTFKVREGFQGLPGQTIHRNKTVSRAYAAIPISAAQYIEGTLYIEHDITHDYSSNMLAKNIFFSIAKYK